MAYLNRLTDIGVFVLDLDGVLTDGTVYVSESGEQLRRMNIKDGYAIQLAIKKGYKIIVISGAGSNTVIKRLNGLGITDIHLAVKDKVAVLENYLQQHHFNLTQVAYIGDDIPDLACMKMVSIAVCPADAVQQIKAIAHYVSPIKGGEGCVRDFIEKVMTIRNDWNNEFSHTTTSA